MTSQKILLLTSSLLGALAVAIGAFGSHALRPVLEANERMDTFDTANKYHFYHVLAILLIALLMERFDIKMLNYAGWFMIAGILFFSGSLYILSYTNITKWGAVAPIGGLSFIIGWILVFVSVLRS